MRLIGRACVAVLMLVAVTPLAMADACLVEPVAINPNQVNSVFGKSRNLPQYNGVPHAHWGVDFQARSPSKPSVGADLVAASAGTVVGAGFWGAGYGNRVVLKRDNGDILIYSHLQKVEPRLKSGAAIGFKDDTNGVGVGSQKVNPGEKVGVAGGTANHMATNERAIHLHLEYVTGYGGTKIRETNDGTNATRSRYMRNVLEYMCKTIKHAPGAGEVTQGTGGAAPAPSPSTPADKDEESVGASAQADAASKAQPSVTDGERYGMPDMPPYDTYEGMSESQIFEAESLRRTLDTEWEEKLTGWSKRGLLVEIARIKGVLTWMDQKIAERDARMEGMYATLLAQRTNQFFTPKLQALYQRAERMSVSKKVN